MQPTQKILLHVIVWLFIITLFLFAGTAGFKTTDAYLIHFIALSVLNVSLFYTNLYLIIPLTLNKQKFIIWFLASIILMLSLTGIKFGEIYYLLTFKNLNISKYGQQELTKPDFWQFCITSIIINGFFVFLSTVYKFTVDWFLNEKEKRDLENQKLIAELAFLKSQINPHFLFNSLNNIYSLAYQKAENTPYAILKLSEILRYMLYESNDEKVALQTELNYLQSFIDLQKLRFKTPTNVVLTVNGNITDQQIMPLILISFLENAFKHGTLTDEKNPIQINILLIKNKLLFTIKNKKNYYNKDEVGGIGMVNVIRRLDLTYPNQYKLSIDNKTDSYYCELYLDL